MYTVTCHWGSNDRKLVVTAVNIDLCSDSQSFTCHVLNRNFIQPILRVQQPAFTSQHTMLMTSAMLHIRTGTLRESSLYVQLASINESRASPSVILLKSCWRPSSDTRSMQSVCLVVRLVLISHMHAKCNIMGQR